MIIDPPFYRGGKLLLLYLGVGLGTFVQVLDTSIANVAIPYIAGSLSVSADEGTWVITSFAASNAIVLPLTGWLSEYIGRVRLFVYSILLFALMSFLCGFSESLTALVFFRVLQGAVAGSLIPLSQSLLLLSTPPEKRGSALGVWAMIVVVAPVVGPIIGGYITEVYSWPWIFYINIPVCFLSAGITWHMLADRESEINRKPIDWVGLILLTVGVGALQVALDKGQDLDWFNSPVIVTLIIVSAIALIYFIVWTYYEPHPVVDLSFFADSNFTLGSLISTIGYLLFFGSAVILPLWLQTQEHYTAFWAGVATAPIGIIPLLFSTLVGRYIHLVDLRFVACMSFLCFAAGFYWLSNLTSDVDLTTIMQMRLLQGVGVVIFFLPLIQLSLADIPPSRYASAAGLYNFLRILVGSGFGTSLSITLWQRRAIFHHSRLVEAITPYNFYSNEWYAQVASLNSSLTRGHINQILETQLEQQSYLLSTIEIFWLGAILFLVMLPIPYICRRVRAPTGKAASASGAH